ncbi:MAG: Ni,Fe-hydrogenase III large subunit [Steroidobacterales bacterium]
MPLKRWFDQAVAVPGAPQVYGLRVTPEHWREAAAAAAAGGGRLLSLWIDGAIGDATDGARSVVAALVADPGVLLLDLPLGAGQRHGGDPRSAEADYPGLQDLFPVASRLQRAAADLSGAVSSDPDTRPWLRHGGWPAGFHPLRDAPVPPAPTAAPDYAFVRVEGEGVHEIAVGPVHAGIIEPGHFRFSVVGEKVLRLEQRLGYVHKGIERRFSELTLSQGHRLAARICGDSAVAYSWAYCQAAEGLAAIEPPARAHWLRALALELERIANHLGDLGALANDAGFAFGLAQFSRLKELLLRATEQALGQRYLMDFIVPGGTRGDLRGAAPALLLGCIGQLSAEAQRLREILDDHAGVRDRWVGAGLVSPTLARRLGLIGLAGRASGQAYDLRTDLPHAPYDKLMPRKSVRSGGDVAARVGVRFDELFESCRLVREILERAPAGAHAAAFVEPLDAGFALGLIEGWRGPVLIGLAAGERGSIRRCHAHDPSWQNWPVLEHAIIDNIVPDFPLINKSFNLSYSGHDL